jgi:hypothetical protein
MNNLRSLAVASSLVLGLLVACGGGDATGGFTDAGGPTVDSGHIGTGTGSDAYVAPGTDTGTIPPTGDTGTGTAEAAAGCPNTCATDSDCQATCAIVTGAVNCCDTGTSSCFTSDSTQCPDQTDAASGGTGSGTGGGY